MAPLADVLLKAERYSEDDRSEMDELIGDGLTVRKLTAEDAEFIRTFPNLETLALNQTGLTTIEEFPPIETVQFLELTDNYLDTSKIQRIPTQFPNLRSLSLGGNRITDLKAMTEIIKAIPTLEDVDLELNPITMSKGDAERVRQTLFNTLPQLKVVNGMDVHGNAVSDDEEEEDEDEENDEPVEGLLNDDEETDKGKASEKSTGKSLLEQFYGKNYKEEDDDDDDEEEDFNPDSCSDDSEDTSEEEDDDEDETKEEPDADEEASSSKRKNEPAPQPSASASGQKKRRVSE